MPHCSEARGVGGEGEVGTHLPLLGVMVLLQLCIQCWSFVVKEGEMCNRPLWLCLFRRSVAGMWEGRGRYFLAALARVASVRRPVADISMPLLMATCLVVAWNVRGA